MLISLGCLVTFAVMGAVDGSFAVAFPARAWTFVVPLALISTALAFFLLLVGLAVLGPVRTGIVATVEPFFVATLAALFLGQPFQRSTLAGGGLIALAVLVIQTARVRRETVSAR